MTPRHGRNGITADDLWSNTSRSPRFQLGPSVEGLSSTTHSGPACYQRPIGGSGLRYFPYRDDWIVSQFLEQLEGGAYDEESIRRSGSSGTGLSARINAGPLSGKA